MSIDNRPLPDEQARTLSDDAHQVCRALNGYLSPEVRSDFRARLNELQELCPNYPHTGSSPDMVNDQCEICCAYAS